MVPSLTSTLFSEYCTNNMSLQRTVRFRESEVWTKLTCTVCSKFSWESWKFTHWESRVQKNNMLENTCCAIHLFINARPKPSNSFMFQYYNNSFFFPSSSTGCCMNVVVLRVIAQLEVLVLLFFSICLLTFASGLADPEWINFTNFTVLWCQFSNSGSLTRCYLQH